MFMPEKAKIWWAATLSRMNSFPVIFQVFVSAFEKIYLVREFSEHLLNAQCTSSWLLSTFIKTCDITIEI